MRALRSVWSERILTPRGVFVDASLLVARIFVIVAMFPNAARKVATFGPTARGMGGEPQLINGRVFPDQTPLFHFPAPELFLAASTASDFFGALLICLGWRTRAVALFMLGYVVLAMTIYHSDIRNSQDVVVLVRGLAFLGGLLALAAVGGGHWSVDGRSRSAAA